MTITATSEGKSATAQVTVAAAAVASVELSPPSGSIAKYATLQLTATPKDQAGGALTGRSVTWSSSNAAVASVSATGLVTGVAAGGPVTITATSEGKSVTAQVTVTVAPVVTVEVSPPTGIVGRFATLQLAATTKDQAGLALIGRTVTWSTSNAAIASVSATGLVTGVAAGGPVTITATSEGKSATSELTIAAAAVASVEMSPPSGTIAKYATLQLTATTKDQGGTTLTGRIVIWSSSNAAVASVSATGLVTGVAAGGPVTITATSEGQSATAQITVTAAPVATVEMSPPTGSIAKFATLQLAATPKDQAGLALTGRTVTWSTSNAAIASVSATGLVTGVAAGGPVTITATSEGQSATASVTVTGAPVVSVEMSPPTGTIAKYATLQLTATPKDQEGTALTGRTITWSTSNAAVATVSTSGLVTGAGAGGPVTITATSEGKSATADVTVTAAPVASVELNQTSGTIAKFATLQLAATPKDQAGLALTGRTVTWTTSDAAVASVSASGLVTGVAAGGPVTITATSEGQSATAQITVTGAPVVTVELSSASASIAKFATLQLTATPKDQEGTALTGRTITWQSSNILIATVSGTGLVTGTGEGGPVTITATSEGQSATAQITVTAAPVASITVSPPSGSFLPAATLQLTATPKDQEGTALNGRTVTWSSSNEAVATVSAAGLVTGVAPGPVTITATSETKTGTASITVLAPVASVQMSTTSASIAKYATLQLTATPKDQGGTALTGRTITWSSSDTGIATVSATGLVTGVTEGGPVTITATSEGISGTAQITITQAPVATVEVGSVSQTVAIGGTVTLSATLKDQMGVTLTGRTITWSSSDASTATVTAGGLVTNVTGGAPVTITATSEGKSGSTSVKLAWVLLEDFSTYTSTTNLHDNPRGVFNAGLDRNRAQIFLDQSDGAPGLTQSMRYDWPNNAGQDYELGRVLRTPSSTKEIWVEVWLKFSTSFTTFGPNSGNHDYKTFFAHALPDGTGRWEFKVGEGFGRLVVAGEETSGSLQTFPTSQACEAVPPTAPCEQAVSEQDNPGSGKYWDGQWYQYRVHFKMESADGANDGALEMWIDGNPYITKTNLNTGNNATEFSRLLYLGANLNKGTSRAMSAWWGRVQAWNTNPGW